jgi:hypothetical protein
MPVVCCGLKRFRGSGFRVLGSGFRGSGFRVQGSGLISPAAALKSGYFDRTKRFGLTKFHTRASATSCWSYPRGIGSTPMK